MLINPDGFSSLYTSPDKIVVVTILYYVLFIPSFFLWIYNIRFLFKNDRYSKAIIPLLFFNLFYSPWYYYARIKNKRKQLNNKINKEPVLNHIVHLEDYKNDEDIEKDLKDL
jgi:hypothetical protein